MHVHTYIYVCMYVCVYVSMYGEAPIAGIRTRTSRTYFFGGGGGLAIINRGNEKNIDKAPKKFLIDSTRENVTSNESLEINSETSFLFQLFKHNSNFTLLKP